MRKAKVWVISLNKYPADKETMLILDFLDWQGFTLEVVEFGSYRRAVCRVKARPNLGPAVTLPGADGQLDGFHPLYEYMRAEGLFRLA